MQELRYFGSDKKKKNGRRKYLEILFFRDKFTYNFAQNHQKVKLLKIKKIKKVLKTKFPKH